jgi:hypothetical protein
VDVFKIIESIEEVLYRIALWIVLLPKTLWFVLTRSDAINDYVASELQKEPEMRFRELMPPVLFWVLVALVPHMMLLDALAEVPDSRVASESLWIAFMHAPWGTRLIVVSTVALAGPLGFAVRSLRNLSVPVDRNSLRLPFSVQCYCFTPAYLALLPVLYFALRYDTVPSGSAKWALTAAGLLIIGWLLRVEGLVLSQQHSVSVMRAVGSAALYLTFVLLLLLLLEITVITIFHGFIVWA